VNFRAGPATTRPARARALVAGVVDGVRLIDNAAGHPRGREALDAARRRRRQHRDGHRLFGSRDAQRTRCDGLRPREREHVSPFTGVSPPTPIARPNELAMVLTQLLDWRGWTCEVRSTPSPIASSVPTVTTQLRGCEPVFAALDVTVNRSRHEIGHALLYDNPREVGPDRIADAVGAFDLYPGRRSWWISAPPPSSTSSAPRASTSWRIAPGSRSPWRPFYSRRRAALRRVGGTALVIGRSTIESIQSACSTASPRRSMAWSRRILVEIGEATIIAPGSRQLVAPHTKYVAHVEPWLTLHGLRIVHERNHLERPMDTPYTFAQSPTRANCSRPTPTSLTASSPVSASARRQGDAASGPGKLAFARCATRRARFSCSLSRSRPRVRRVRQAAPRDWVGVAGEVVANQARRAVGEGGPWVRLAHALHNFGEKWAASPISTCATAIARRTCGPIPRRERRCFDAAR